MLTSECWHVYPFRQWSGSLFYPQRKIREVNYLLCWFESQVALCECHCILCFLLPRFYPQILACLEFRKANLYEDVCIHFFFFNILRSKAKANQQKVLWKDGLMNDNVSPPGLNLLLEFVNLSGVHCSSKFGTSGSFQGFFFPALMNSHLNTFNFVFQTFKAGSTGMRCTIDSSSGNQTHFLPCLLSWSQEN